MGRRSTFTQATFDKICEKIAKGQSLRSICREKGMPAISSFNRWLHGDEKKALREQYAKAMRDRADAMFEEILEISDNTDGDHQRDRLRVDTRKWMLGKMQPKKYSDKYIISADEDSPPFVVMGVPMAKSAEEWADKYKE